MARIDIGIGLHLALPLLISSPHTSVRQLSIGPSPYLVQGLGFDYPLPGRLIPQLFPQRRAEHMHQSDIQ